MNIPVKFNDDYEFEYELHNDPCFYEWAKRVQVLPVAARYCALEIGISASKVLWPKGGSPFPVATWGNVLRKIKRPAAVQALQQLETAGLVKVWSWSGRLPFVQLLIPKPGDEFMVGADWLREPWRN